jgi:hypothetical protein
VNRHHHPWRTLIPTLAVTVSLSLPWMSAAFAADREDEGHHHGKAVPEPPEDVSPGSVVSVFEEVSEAAESTIAGGFLKFFELAPKVRNILAAHNKGDDATAVAAGIGTITEYGLAIYLIEALGFAELFTAEWQPTIEWAGQIGQAIGGTVGVTKFSEFSGDMVEKTTHHSLASETTETKPNHHGRETRPEPED